MHNKVFFVLIVASSLIMGTLATQAEEVWEQIFFVIRCCIRLDITLGKSRLKSNVTNTVDLILSKRIPEPFNKAIQIGESTKTTIFINIFLSKLGMDHRLLAWIWFSATNNHAELKRTMIYYDWARFRQKTVKYRLNSSERSISSLRLVRQIINSIRPPHTISIEQSFLKLRVRAKFPAEIFSRVLAENLLLSVLFIKRANTIHVF